MPIWGKVESLLLRYTYHIMQQEQVSRPICGKVGPLLLGHSSSQQEQVFRPICGKLGPLLLGHTYHQLSHSKIMYSGQY
jgi:hypothetical protein